MNQAETVKRYLRDHREVDQGHSGFPFVTISRQAGTGGHAIGRFILQKLALSADPDLNKGWDLFDQKLCALIAQDKSLEADFDTLVEDKYQRDGLQQMVYEMFVGAPQQYKIQKKIADVIRLLARLGKVVIIGRGSSVITRNMPTGIHVRLIAPMPMRIQNVMDEYKLSEKHAVRRLREIERDRSRFIRNFYHHDINDPTLYDITWNLGHVRTTEIVDTMCEMIRLRLVRLRSARSEIATRSTIQSRADVIFSSARAK